MAAVVTPVSIRVDRTWTLVGGTSVASPLLAGIEAHASASVRSLGAQAFYQDPGSLHDVTEGFDWNSFNESGSSECAPREYLCNAGIGYDGPTGLGTPDGVPAVTPEPPTLKKISPRRGPLAGGTTVRISGTGLAGAIEVDFGSSPAKEFTVSSATSIIAVTAPGSATGSVPVSVVTPAGKTGGHSVTFSYQRTR